MSVFSPGDVIGNGLVKLIRLVGRGAQAEIWAVADVSFPDHANLALKLRYVPWDERSNPEFLASDERQREEVRLLGSCQSTHIVAPHFLVGGKEEGRDGKFYAVAGVVMGLASEGSLDVFAASGAFQGFTLEEKVRLFYQMAMGLTALEWHEIIHNDIKPANILINHETGRFVPRFADFGYSYRLGSPLVRGFTPLYAAPELLMQTGDPGFETDVFSLGMTYYEILVGHHPLETIPSEGDQILALRGWYSTHEYVDATPLVMQRVPEGLRNLIQKMCSRTPGDRPTAAEVAATLQSLIQADPAPSESRPEDHYPQLANRFRWAETIHKTFGEEEQIYFVRGTRHMFDRIFLNEQLTQKRFFGFSILRLLGSSDYLLRIWRRPSDVALLDGVMNQYRYDRGGFEVFTPTIRFPRPTPAALRKFETTGAVLEMLNALADGLNPVRLRDQGILQGETKFQREIRRKKHAIRVVCRIKAKTSLQPRLTAVVAEEAYKEARSDRRMKEVEVLACPGQDGAKAEFLLIAELDNFHDYGEVIGEIEGAMSGILGPEVIEAFQSHFEMDRLSNPESYDGRILAELHRVRTRRHRPSV